MANQTKNDELFLEKELLSPCTYYLQVKDKRLVLKIIKTFNHWLRIPAEKFTSAWEVLQMIYVSCLLCDDIQDNAKVRGVLPAAQCVYGIPLTINASFHMLLLVLQKASNLCPEACMVIIEEYLTAYRGQGTEIYWRDNFICPTEEQYIKMIEQKTGGFFMMAVRFLQSFSENKTDYSKIILNIGNYFQVFDDYCNLNYLKGLRGWSENEDKKVSNNNEFCEDITEGKFTFPIIHAIQTEYGEEILNILRQRTSDVNVKKHCLSLLEKAGSLQYTRDALTKFDREAKAEMARLGGNPVLEAILDELLDCRTSRKVRLVCYLPANPAVKQQYLFQFVGQSLKFLALEAFYLSPQDWQRIGSALTKELLSPCTYYLQVKEKKLTLTIIEAFNHWLRVPTEKLTPVWEMIHMIYISCVLCDDIQDDSKVRGVLPAAHRVYGIPLSINALIHMLLLVLEKASNLCPEACKVITEEYLTAYRGQGTEIYWRDNFICPTEEQYFKMIEQKSGGFFMMAVRFLQLFSANKTDCRKLILVMGKYFQVYDDYCNLNYLKGLKGWSESEDKKVCNNNQICEDITEGKFTLPIIHAIQTEYGEEILNILRQRTTDVKLKKHCLSLLAKAGSLQYTRDTMTEFDREARAEVARLGGNPVLEGILDELLGWKL